MEGSSGRWSSVRSQWKAHWGALGRTLRDYDRSTRRSGSMHREFIEPVPMEADLSGDRNLLRKRFPVLTCCPARAPNPAASDLASSHRFRGVVGVW